MNRETLFHFLYNGVDREKKKAFILFKIHSYFVKAFEKCTHFFRKEPNDTS